ncbi:hypothetical protein TWF696_009300 [Orbilia brochopaga]|uniref:F-box domain-containing protein n=1 Tax=Orbilia brochopaga TaxID=3140254 RepID=A0AAV9UEN0_9PEZI
MSTRTRRSAAGKPSSSSAVVSYSTPRQSKYPAWKELPYLILLEIFRYAATKPLDNGNPLNHAWILGAAVTCKAFNEPAINLLYSSPPTIPYTRLRKLYEAIKNNPALGTKVHTIESLTTDILDPKIARFEFDSLLRFTPNIRDVCIGGLASRVDTMFQPTTKRISMSPAVLTTLEEMNVSLRSWTWDGYLCWGIAAQYDPRPDAPKMSKEKRGFGWLDAVHSDLAVFKSLRKLTLTIFDFPLAWEPEPGSDSGGERSEDEVRSSAQTDIATIAGAIGRLKYLTDLTFFECAFVNGYFLSQIAGMQLKRLALEAIFACDTGDLQTFLRAGGKSLQELEIKSCGYIRVGFMSVLETATPNLKRLLFEDIPGLVDDQALEVLDIPMPQWPATLESLVMRSLGNWKVLDCEVFLRSLVDTARQGGFMSLREIDVWCILPKLGWRDRAESRKRWGDEFMMAFQDRREDAWKEFLRKKESEGEAIKEDPHAVQGLCQKVLFRLDDSRPTGNQLREEDFLDLEGRGSNGRTPKKASRPAARKSSNTKAKGKGKATASTSKKPSPKKKRSASSGQKRTRASTSQSFVVGRKRPRYNSEDDEDFKVDQLAYDDEDGNDSSWSVDDEYN